MKEFVAVKPGNLDVDEGHPLNAHAMAIHGWAERKGWNEVELKLAEKLLLIISEITEAFEHYRDGLGLGDIFYDENGKPDGFGIELADAAIRLFHLCARIGLDLDRLMAIKMAYNEQRPYRHGDKKA